MKSSFRNSNNDKFPMTKKAEKKLKGLLAAQDLNDCQKTSLSPTKKKGPTRANSSNTLVSFVELSMKKKIDSNSFKRSKHKVETLTKKKIIKRFFNSKAFLKHQERFGNLLDDSNSFERFNAYKRTSFLTTFSSQADMAQRKKMKKHKGKKMTSSSKIRDKQPSDLKSLKKNFFRDVRSQGGPRNDKKTLGKSRFNKSFKYGKEKEKTMDHAITQTPKKKKPYALTQKFLRSKEIIQNQGMILRLKPRLRTGYNLGRSEKLKRYTSPRTTTFPKPGNLQKIISTMKRVRSPEVQFGSLHNFFDQRKDRTMMSPQKWDLTSFAKVNLNESKDKKRLLGMIQSKLRDL